MRKQYIGPPAFVLLALLPLAGRADDGVVIYGRLNLAEEAVKVESSQGSLTQVRLSNNRSVVGFRGEEGLGEGLKLIWQIENSVAPDDASASGFATRDSRLGLAGRYGTVFAGNWTLPYNLATQGFDPFYPTTAGYMALLGNGAAPTVNNTSNIVSFDRRQQNVVQYWTPNWQGWSGKLAWGTPEEKGSKPGYKPQLWSAAVSYEADGLIATLAHEIHEDYQSAGGRDTGSKLGLAYQWGSTRLAAIWERLRYETGSGVLARNAWYLSATQQLGKLSLRLGYGHAADGSGPASQAVGGLRSGDRTGAAQLTVGAEYGLSKRTFLQAYASRLRNEDRASYDFAINRPGASPGSRANLLAAGLRHNF
ncbi:porin [Chitinimonas sp.]|uniref:porin n=1 Tax=Chitinimonas sp. TaxID=1934313 RepID=UPI002F94B3CC